MKVKDFMIRNVYTIHGRDTLKEAIQKLIDYNIGGMPVVDDDGKLIGMLSDGDILRYMKPRRRISYDYNFYMPFLYTKEELEEIASYLKTVCVIEIARKRPLYTVCEDDNLERVLNILATHRFKKVPVINEKREVVGVISRGDLIRVIQKRLIDEL